MKVVEGPHRSEDFQERSLTLAATRSQFYLYSSLFAFSSRLQRALYKNQTLVSDLIPSLLIFENV